MMRRTPLPPPRRVRLGPVIPLEEALGAASGGVSIPALDLPLGERLPRGDRELPLGHAVLAGPSPARPRLRRLFDPAAGWFRTLERRASHHLTRTIYPLVPGLGLPYGAIVDRRLTVCESDIVLPSLPGAFEGMRLLLVTDLHLGPFLPPKTLARAFDRLLALEPDLILLGGDITTSRVEEFAPYARTFRSLSTPLGVFAVMGNHDYYTGGIERLRGMIEETGIPVLHNRSVVLERGDGRLPLAGIDDLIEGTPDLDAALDGISRTAGSGSSGGDSTVDAAPVLLLSHNPDVFFEAARRGVSLVLSGHTHGGQIRIPGLPVLVRQSRYRLDEGRYETDGSQLVVSRGLGATGLPLRFACPPEAVLLRLVTA